MAHASEIFTFHSAWNVVRAPSPIFQWYKMVLIFQECSKGECCLFIAIHDWLKTKDCYILACKFTQYLCSVEWTQKTNIVCSISVPILAYYRIPSSRNLNYNKGERMCFSMRLQCSSNIN